MQKQAKVKHAEAVEAAGILGITDVRFLNHDDSVLLVTDELVQAVARVIRDVRPHIVITHYPLEEGGVASHHGNTGKITLYAIQAAGNVWSGDPNPGYRVAQVFFTVMGDESERKQTLAGLRSCRSFLRQRIGENLRLRMLPELRFRYDDSLDRSFKVDEILDELAEKPPSGADDVGDDSGEGGSE